MSVDRQRRGRQVAAVLFDVLQAGGKPVLFQVILAGNVFHLGQDVGRIRRRADEHARQVGPDGPENPCAVVVLAGVVADFKGGVRVVVHEVEFIQHVDHVPRLVEGLVATVEARVQDADDEPSPSASRDSIARFNSVAVIEGRSGIIVTVTDSNGAEMSHVASSSEGGVEAAVVKAAASLVDPKSPDPLVVEIEDRRVEGVDIVMIVLDMDGELFAGSAVVGAGRAFALGRAAWAALAL